MGRFTEHTAVEQIETNLWRGEFREGWRIGVVPNGGYVLAVAGRALSQALPHADPLSVNAFYLAPTVLGPVDVQVEVLRSGGNTTQAHARMYQDGELKVVVTAAYTDLDKLKGESWTCVERPQIPGWDDCRRPQDSGLEFRQQVELRLDQGGEVLGGDDAPGTGQFSGWIAHADGAEPDATALLMFSDSFPPPVFTIFGRLGWIPTVELTVQVRAKPASGPIQAQLNSRHLTRGVIEEDGLFWDSTGELVAISRQTAKVRMPKN